MSIKKKFSFYLFLLGFARGIVYSIDNLNGILGFGGCHNRHYASRRKKHKGKKMKNRVLLDLARWIKFYASSQSSLSVGGYDALVRFLESQGYACAFRGRTLCVFDRSGDLVMGV